MLFPANSWITRLQAPVRDLGPYAAIALTLPGGTLVALSLWALRHRGWFVAHRRVLAEVALLGVGLVVPG